MEFSYLQEIYIHRKQEENHRNGHIDHKKLIICHRCRKRTIENRVEIAKTHLSKQVGMYNKSCKLNVNNGTFIRQDYFYMLNGIASI
jgi:hypothetical protein